MKAGASKADINQIVAGFDQGMSASKISKILRIEESVVKAHKPKAASSKKETPASE